MQARLSLTAIRRGAIGADGQRDGFGSECEGHCGVCGEWIDHRASGGVS